MRNGQLKAAYNIQASSNNQFITNYTLEQTTTDTTTLIKHLNEHHTSFGSSPEVVTADAGYGSEENYQDLEDKGIEAYVKYNYFHKEQKETKTGKTKHPFGADKLYYNTETDTYYCPMGQAMNHIGNYSRETKTGYKQIISRYRAQNCQGCPLRAQCHKAKGNRIVERNHN
ncbi:transposase, partial [Aquimarina addita]|uniref:transposase n=1 Tax=Aquimarina addita TaxID=870485 RepID=UPI0031EBFBF5